jgi:hypothetical protein
MSQQSSAASDQGLTPSTAGLAEAFIGIATLRAHRQECVNSAHQPAPCLLNDAVVDRLELEGALAARGGGMCIARSD